MFHFFCSELEIIGKNSMLYDPVNNLPYPCDSETKPSRKSYLEDSSKDSGLWYKSSLKTMNKKVSSTSSKRSSGSSLYRNKMTKRTLYKRGDGDSIPIKLPPCPFPNGTQEHRWLKSKFKMQSSGQS